MRYIDEKYVMLLSPRLNMFKRTGTNDKPIYNFRCPYCLDSEKSKFKRRGFIYGSNKIPTLLYKCHNCGVSVTFGTLLKFMDEELYSAYNLERYREGAGGRSAHKNCEIKSVRMPEEVAKQLTALDMEESDIGLPSIKDLPDNDPNKQYILKRRIPEEFHDQIFVASDFKKWASSKVTPEKYATLVEGESRILFPFISPDKKLIGGQGRTIDPKNKVRYVTFKTDDNEELIYGMERLDPTKLVYVVEGPIDSLFLPNGIASAGSDLGGSIERLKKYIHIPDENIVLVHDNEPRNKQVVQLMEKGSLKYKIVIWPDTLHEKDLNDMILSGLTREQLLDIIKKHTYEGLSASLELNSWKKC